MEEVTRHHASAHFGRKDSAPHSSVPPVRLQSGARSSSQTALDAQCLVTIQKLVHGGQGLAELADGRKVFVWNALPGEVVRVRIIKKKRSYAEAIAEEVVKASPEREQPREENYLATSPWQMMSFETENRYKAEIVRELFAHEKVELPEFGEVVHDDRQWQYRNKMEYSFWGDDDGLHLALHRRGSHGKQIVQGSELALPILDEGARAILEELNKLYGQPAVGSDGVQGAVERRTEPYPEYGEGAAEAATKQSAESGGGAASAAGRQAATAQGRLRAGDLKTIIVRVSQTGDVVAALYTKLDSFAKISQPSNIKGLRVYHSNPKSPASVPTKLLYELGDATLQDELLGKPFTYDVDSFFQVNLPIYEKALTRIREHSTEDPVDMYSGVGSIGLSVARQSVQLVELDPATAAMGRVNAEASGIHAEVIEASTEKALEYITGDKPVIFDPPRAGLHAKVVECCLEVLPPQIIYLSCNPATQARDLAMLQERYTIEFFEIYNFFPRTPHIETLAVLAKKPAES